MSPKNQVTKGDPMILVFLVACSSWWGDPTNDLKNMPAEEEGDVDVGTIEDTDQVKIYLAREHLDVEDVKKVKERVKSGHVVGRIVYDPPGATEQKNYTQFEMLDLEYGSYVFKVFEVVDGAEKNFGYPSAMVLTDTDLVLISYGTLVGENRCEIENLTDSCRAEAEETVFLAMQTFGVKVTNMDTDE